MTISARLDEHLLHGQDECIQRGYKTPCGADEMQGLHPEMRLRAMFLRRSGFSEAQHWRALQAEMPPGAAPMLGFGARGDAR